MCHVHARLLPRRHQVLLISLLTFHAVYALDILLPGLLDLFDEFALFDHTLQCLFVLDSSLTLVLRLLFQELQSCLENQYLKYSIDELCAF